ncbi:MerR family transcriptional regulator [Plantactinospora sp. B5E13]|uniref:helix-turn-helix domain-containing protein n=1 Tax=Plantactinospora sp. B5E13 TaxID=3153758 RepID=UPI00325CEEF4
MEDDTEHLTVGQLAVRTGVPARTIRFWSDAGVLPPAGRSPAGHRRYAPSAVDALDLVRTLRELGIGLTAVRRVLSGQAALAEVANQQVAVMDAQLRILRMRRTVLRAVGRRGPTELEISLMHRLAQLSAPERQQMIDTFVDRAFTGVDDQDAEVVAGWMRELPPTLPDEPTPEQVDAWMELAELVADEEFQATVRRLVLAGGVDNRFDYGLHVRAAVLRYARPAVDEGIPPESAEAEAVLARIVPTDLSGVEVADLLAWLDTVTQPGVERYWQLLDLVEGRTPPPPAVPAFAWLADALRAHR